MKAIKIKQLLEFEAQLTKYALYLITIPRVEAYFSGLYLNK
jgi:hypothetical protein